MGDGAGGGAKGDAQGGEPGALSRLLEELARAPQAGREVAWGKGLRPGDVLDRFEVVRELGRGGFGAVYEALDRELGRKVALKTLRPGRSRDEWADEQLRGEAQAAASLSHPGIVTLHEACICDRGPYLVMELLRGETLEARLSRGPLPPGEAVEVGLQISRALTHVHSHGLVHRDLKPGNVYLGEDGRVKLLDLGLAHLLGRKSSTGGTPAYVAPEQWRGETVDGRADVFALGAVLFEMISGRRAFEVTEERSSALDPGPAPTLEEKTPRGLRRLVARCLAKDPGARPTAGQAAEDLLAIQRGLARPRAARRLALLVGAGVLAGIAIAAVALRGVFRPAGGVSPDGRIAVAVADVVNETGERELDVLSGLLVTSLEQSRRLSVMTQARVLDLAAQAGRKDAARVDETLGREVGKAHGVRALLLPAIRRLGTTYSLEMRAIDPGRDEHLFTLSDRATSKEGLLGLLDRLSERARLELGEGRKEVAGASVQLGEAMTRSLEAYQHYVVGLEGWNRDGLRAVALAEFEEALRLDPGFAAAHGELARLLGNYGRVDLAAPHWRAADDNIGRMPAKERHVLLLRRAYSAPASGGWNRDEARRRAEEAVARFTSDKHVLGAAAAAFDFLALSEQRDAALRQALELDPGFWAAARLLSTRLGERTDEALAVARRAVATRRSAANLTLLAEALHAAGEARAAVAAARQALDGDGGRNSLAAKQACLVLYQSGADAECRAIWERMRTDSRSLLERDAASQELLESLFVRGRVREGLRALRTLEEPRRGHPGRLAIMLTIGHRRGLAPPEAVELARRIEYPTGRRNILAWIGAKEEAEHVDATLPDRAARVGSEREAWTVNQLIYEAIQLADRGRFAEAAELMRAAYDSGKESNSPAGAWRYASFVAEMLLAAGRPAEAIRVEPPTLPCRCREPVDHAAYYPSFALARARAMEQLGRRADALRELDGVIVFWKEADQDLPLLVEAKAMRKRLAAASVAASAPAVAKVSAATPSIAVLPFADMSPGKDQEYFADGVAEEILNALSHVEGLHVAGRTSSFSFKGKRVAISEIGRQLNVRAVLEGSVRREGNQVRITAQVVNVSDGYRLWSEKYDRELSGLFAVQDDVAQAVVEALRVKLLPGKSLGPAEGRTTDPDSYNHYLMGIQFLRQGTLEGARRSRAALQRALDLDPRNAAAQAAMAGALNAMYEYTGAATAAEVADVRRQALAAAEKAVAMAPNLADGFRARGYLRLSFFEWAGARADLDHALALGPNDPHTLAAHAQMLSTLGRVTEGIASSRRAAELDPISPNAWAILCHLYQASGQLSLARRACGRLLEITPDNPWAHFRQATLELLEGQPRAAFSAALRIVDQRDALRLAAVAMAEHDLGHVSESDRALEQLTSRSAHDSQYQIAQVHAWLGDGDRTFEWLERSYHERDGAIAWLKFDPLLRKVRGDPRYTALVRKVNLPPD